ncbi:MAG: FecR domain-containing protein [Spirochaetaceae bacterium]
MNNRTCNRAVKVFAASALFFAAAVPVSSITAVVEDIKGKVELKVREGTWERAERGMEIGMNTTISTGFNSEAEIAIGESTLEVDALTRMDLEELIEKEGTIDTTLNLKVGKVKADVRSSEGMRNNFKLRSPQSTAAVRGTSFEYDGYTLTVDEGVVTLSNNIGQSRTVSQGEGSSTDGFSSPSGAEADILADFDENITEEDEEEILQLIRDEIGDEYATLILNLYGSLEEWYDR